MTLEELNKIKNEYKDLVKVRKVIAEEGEKLAAKTGYRKQVLVCGGTGCTSSGSKKVIAALEEALKENDINDVLQRALRELLKSISKKAAALLKSCFIKRLYMKTVLSYLFQKLISIRNSIVLLSETAVQ